MDTSFPGWTLELAELFAFAELIFVNIDNELRFDDRVEVLGRVSQDLHLAGLPEGRSYDSRYGSLALLAWFLERWPYSPGSSVGIDLLTRWSIAKRNRVSRHLGVPDWHDPWNPGPHEIEPAIQARLRELLESARAG